MNTRSARLSISDDSPVVLKLGGSLLTLPDLADRLRALISLLHPHSILIVPGGGAAADHVRELDRRYQLPPETAHWLAVAAMSFNAGMLVRLNQPQLGLVRSRDDAIRIWKDNRVAVLDTLEFLRDEERTANNALPVSWDVTSDSIAAWIAKRWMTSGLVLAKSCELSCTSTERAARLGLVDPFFPQASDNVAVGWVNLRKRPFVLSTLDPVEG